MGNLPVIIMLIERLKQLEFNIQQLKVLSADIHSDNINLDIQKQWALRYGLFESIQIVIDISCHLVSKNNLGNTKSYRDCIEALEKFNYISVELANSIKSMIGLRNILIHDYVKIDVAKLTEYLNDLSDFEQFSIAIAPYLNK